MFHPKAREQIGGPDIDVPGNAICLTLDFHIVFGDFKIYFELKSAPSTYLIDAWKPSTRRTLNGLLPTTRTIVPRMGYEAPSPKLFAVHRAVGRILHLSGAGAYIDKLLRDLDDVAVVAEDGSTNLSEYLFARLGRFQEVSAY
jgi:HNH endonuclease